MAPFCGPNSGRRLLTLEHVASFYNSAWIDRDVTFVDVSNNSFFIDQESGAISKALLLVEDTIVFHDSAFEIAEYRKGDSNLLCKLSVGGNTVNTHSENLRFG